MVEWLKEYSEGHYLFGMKSLSNGWLVVACVQQGSNEGEHDNISVEVFRPTQLARWFDAANLYMRQEVVEWEDAMAQTWPADEDAEPVLDSIEAAEEQAA